MRKDMETNEETKYLNPTSKVEYAEFEEQCWIKNWNMSFIYNHNLLFSFFKVF